VRLDDARAEFRTRRPLEAVDFGVHVTRAHAWPITRAILTFSLGPTLALVAVALYLDAPAWGAAAVFWLRPIDGRIALLVASRGLFGDVPSLRATGRLLVAEGRRRLLWDLTLGRLSFIRSVTLPVAILEGAERSRRSLRMSLVTQGVGGTATALAVGCLALELTLAGAATSLWQQATELGQLVGPGTPETAFFDDDAEGTEDPATLAGFVLAYALAAPLGEVLFSLSGFALYLNRRTLVEGWDIELAFRRLARRVGAVVLIFGLGFAAQARAEDEPQAGVSAVEAALAAAEAEAETKAKHDRARTALETILARPEFGEEVTVERYELRYAKEPSAASEAATPDLAWLRVVAEVLTWFVVAVLATTLIYLVARMIPFIGRPRRAASRAAEREPARVRHGEVERAIDVRDVALRARRLAREGRALEALSLLYVGSIQALAARFALELPDGATEGDCLRAVVTRVPHLDAQRFAAVTRAWQLAAYRGELPDEPEVGRLAEAVSALFGEAS
jgi:hypothetical protein